MADLSLAYGAPSNGNSKSSGPSNAFGDFGAPIGEELRYPHDRKVKNNEETSIKSGVSEDEYERKMRDRQASLEAPIQKSTPINAIRQAPAPGPRYQEVPKKMSSPPVTQSQPMAMAPHDFDPTFDSQQPQRGAIFIPTPVAAPPRLLYTPPLSPVKRSSKANEAVQQCINHPNSAKLVVMTLVILTALSINSVIEQLLGSYVTSVDWSPDREMILRIVYPLLAVLALWFVSR